MARALLSVFDHDLRTSARMFDPGSTEPIELPALPAPGPPSPRPVACEATLLVGRGEHPCPRWSRPSCPLPPGEWRSGSSSTPGPRARGGRRWRTFMPWRRSGASRGSGASWAAAFPMLPGCMPRWPSSTEGPRSWAR
jgi:hypothetical protein